MQDKGLFLLTLVLLAGIAIGGFLTLAYSGTQRAIQQLSSGSPQPQVQKSSNSGVQQILDLPIPLKDAAANDWQQFFLAVKGLQITDKRGKISYGLNHNSPKIGLLAVMAKRAPLEFIRLVENREISQYTFSYFLEAGLLRDWARYSEYPEGIMLANSQALFAVGLDHDDLAQLRRRVAEAFLNTTSAFKLDMRSLAFALPAMQKGEQQRVISKLLEGQIKYDPRSVVVLERANLFSPEQLNQLVEHQAYSQKSMSSYQFDSSKWGNDQYLVEMAKDATTNSDQPMNFYCAICTLAALTDGLVAQNLSGVAQAGTLRISKGRDVWILESEGEIK